MTRSDISCVYLHCNVLMMISSHHNDHISTNKGEPIRSLMSNLLLMSHAHPVIRPGIPIVDKNIYKYESDMSITTNNHLEFDNKCKTVLLQCTM